MTNPTQPLDLARSDLAKAVLAAWVNVPVDQLPAEKMWIEHPNDLNRQAWDRVIEAAQRPLLDRIAELEGERDKIDAAMREAAEPRTYAHRYPYQDGSTVIRYGTLGREINGARPIEAIPLYGPEVLSRALAAEAQVSALQAQVDGLREAGQAVVSHNGYEVPTALMDQLERALAASQPPADEAAKGGEGHV